MKKENWATDFLTNLAKIYADDVEVIEIIEDTINGYGDYVAYVHKMESLKPILKIKLAICVKTANIVMKRIRFVS